MGDEFDGAVSWKNMNLKVCYDLVVRCVELTEKKQSERESESRESVRVVD